MKFTHKGFSLSELLLASAILVFALAGLLALFIHCLFLNADNRNLSLATGHAQYVLEEIKNTNFLDIQTDINNGNWDWDSTEIESEGLDALSAESIDTQVSGTDPLDIAVTVNWTDRSGRMRTLTLETLFTDTG